jgi:hypothetical protein
MTQDGLVMRYVVAAELWQGSTLPYSCPLSIGHRDKPYTALGVHAPAGAGRLAEMEHTLLYIYFY